MVYTQNFYSRTPIYTACELVGYRPVMSYVLFKNGYAWASEGHIAVRCKISELSDFPEESIQLLENSLIHCSALKEVYKAKGVVTIEKRTEKDGDKIKEFPVFVVKKDFWTVEYPCKMNGDELTYPNIEKVFQVKPAEAKTKYTFNPKCLSVLTKAMGLTDNNCTISFSEGYTACLVTSHYSPVEGLIMPILNED